MQSGKHLQGINNTESTCGEEREARIDSHSCEPVTLARFSHLETDADSREIKQGTLQLIGSIYLGSFTWHVSESCCESVSHKHTRRVSALFGWVPGNPQRQQCGARQPWKPYRNAGRQNEEGCGGVYGEGWRHCPRSLWFIKTQLAEALCVCVYTLHGKFQRRDHRYGTVNATCHYELPFWDGTVWQPSYLGPVFKVL